MGSVNKLTDQEDDRVGKSALSKASNTDGDTRKEDGILPCMTLCHCQNSLREHPLEGYCPLSRSLGVVKDLATRVDSINFFGVFQYEMASCLTMGTLKKKDQTGFQFIADADGNTQNGPQRAQMARLCSFLLSYFFHSICKGVLPKEMTTIRMQARIVRFKMS